jgi:soluble lytic murein transglycosylase-like protein
MATIIMLLISTAFANFDSHVDKYSELYRIDKNIIKKIIEVESSGRELVYSDGCIGLMQIKYDTAKLMDYKGSLQDLYKPENNIKYATKYLRYLMIAFDGDMHKVLAAYNRGPNHVDKRPDKDWSKDRYVKKILGE